MNTMEAARMDLIQADTVLDVAARNLKGHRITDPAITSLIRNIHETATSLLQQISRQRNQEGARDDC